MGRKNFVYENLFKEYNALRLEELKKTNNAMDKIKDAKAKIEENKKEMEKATEAGDLEAYAELNADNAKNEEIIKFFSGVLEAAKQNTSTTPEKITELCQIANAEIKEIKDNYNAKFIELMQPIIELSLATKTQVDLLELAKDKIHQNLAKDKNFAPYNDSFCKSDTMKLLNQLLQNNDYKHLDQSHNVNLNGRVENIWFAKANETRQREAAKWL